MVKVLRSFVRGPLEPHMAGFARLLLRQGYTQASAEQHVCFIAHLDRWMSAEGVGLDGLSVPVIEHYLACRRAQGYVEYRSLKALRPLLDYLSPLGVLPAAEPVALGPVEELLSCYHGYLVTERGLTAGTARGYVDLVRPFVAGRADAGELELAGLTAAGVTGFVVATCPGMRKGTAKLTVTALRSLLGWLHLAGEIPAPLAWAVPAVASWRLAGLPKALEPGQVGALLASCDQDTAAGRRDLAMLTMLARLGLRAGEVAGLRLDDIDWRAGEITVRGKGDRAERLPLPADAGEAIAAYLGDGRPEPFEGDRRVFLRVRAPHRGLTSGGVTEAVFSAGQRAGVGPVHAHVLRHSAATGMLRAGAPLTEIGQVLRHRRLLSTAIYAKVDIDSLRALARPWPAGGAE